MHDTSRHARIFAQEFSGRQARRIVAQLTGLHRIKASPDLLAAARLAHELAKAAGLADLRLHEFPTDGKGFWWTFKKPWFWSPRSAELRLIAPEEAVLARFADEPCRLGDFSAATPAGGVVAEVVDVGQGLAEADYAGKDLAGKVALVSGAGWNSGRVSAQAARHAALGIIGDSLVEVPPARTRENAAEQVGYARVWVDPAGSSPFWFGINYQQMQYLKRLLAAGRGPLRVRAAVDAALGEGTLPVVSGVIPGSGRPEEEVLLVAHICHGAPGANDNASGSALLLEMAAAWCRLIADGRLPRPSRTIRFLWLPEWYGTAAYLHAHPDWPDRLRAAICCDMVGEDQQACGGPLLLERGPDTLPAFLNDLAEHFLEQLTAGAGSYFSDSADNLWKYQVVPYGGGSDHSFFVDRTCGVPAVYIGHWPDRFYHSSHDTVDKVDPAELEKVARLTFQLAQAVADAGPVEAALFARETTERGLGRVGRAASQALWSLHDLPQEDPAEPYSTRVTDHLRRALEVLDYRTEIEMAAVASAGRLAPGDAAVTATVAAGQDELQARAARLRTELLDAGEALVGAAGRQAATFRPAPTAEEQQADRIVPERRWIGLLDVVDYTAEVLGLDRTAWLSEHTTTSLGTTVALRMASLWVDGERSLLEISRRVALSTGMPADLVVLERYFRDLAEARAVVLRERHPSPVAEGCP